MNVPGASKYWGRMAFRLPVLIALFAAIAGLVSGAIAYYVAYGSYVDREKERMELVRNERSRAVIALIENYRVGLGSLATRQGIGADIEAFSGALAGMGDAERGSVIKGYTSGNPFPADSRSAITDAGDGSAYTARHRMVHERLLRLLQIKELDDLLLVDARGNVVYTVPKSVSFMTV